MTDAIVDNFAGLGGWSEALRALGHSEIGVERDAAACATRAAAGHLTIRADVAQYPAERFGPIEGLIASPPCPTFSAAGKGEGIGQLPDLHRAVHRCLTGWVAPDVAWSDPRTPLVLEPLRWAHACQPTWIALEQVPPVLPVWESMAHVLRAWGYSVWCGVLNAADFGVPQTRKRAILMAHRTRPVTAPEPTHARAPVDSLFGRRLPWVSMAEALGWTEPARMGFPRLDDRGDSPDGYRERDWREGDEPAFALTEKARSWVIRERQSHGAERRMDEPAPTVDTKAGNAWTLHTNRDQREDGSRQACETSAPAPALTAKAGGQWAFERPATTIVGSFSPETVAAPGWRGPGDGPRQNAEGSIKITVRDALILQSFDPDYPVQGTKTKQFEQVGNAVPPVLARAVLGVLL